MPEVEKREAPCGTDTKKQNDASAEERAREPGEKKKDETADTTVRRRTRQAKKDPAESAEVESLKKQLAETNDRLMRTAAEYDNYRKRTERERISSLEYGKAQMLRPLLPVFDGIERADSFDAGSPEYLKGIEMIIKQFRDLKRVMGIEEVGTVGEQFDPTLHEAVSHIEDENLGKNTVSEIMQKGYKFGDVIIRTAMVQVAN